MTDISAIIAAKGNPPHILETIHSVQNFVAEIIIIDIGIDSQLESKIKNIDLVKVIKLEKTPHYIELIREETKKYAQYDYILFLDSDELLTSELKNMLKTTFQNYDYVKIPRKNILFGAWVSHSRWWPDYQIRLFKKDKVIWPKKLHAQPNVEGNCLTLEPKEELAILHYNYENIDEYLQKMIRYSKAEAKEYIQTDQKLTLNHTIQKGVSEFISRYFAHEGYKDGMHGFALGFLQLFYYFLVYFYYWEEKKYESHNEKTLALESKNFFQHGLFEVNYWLLKEKFLFGKQAVLTKIANKLEKISK